MTTLETPRATYGDDDVTGFVFGEPAVSGRRSARCLNRRFGDVTIAGCGRAYEHGSEWTSVHRTEGGSWRGLVASCGNPWACDFCAPREQAVSRERWGWHFGQHLASGGELVEVTLTLPHRRGRGLKALMNDLRRLFTSLLRSSAWRGAFVDYVAVLQVRWSPSHGWHPHLHVVGFTGCRDTVSAGALTEVLGSVWRSKLGRVGYRAIKGRGVLARKLRDMWGALYAWSWADDAREPADPAWDTRVSDWEPQANLWEQDGSRSVWDLARAALGGDGTAVKLWREYLAATKGRRVVSCSTRLNELWQFHVEHDPPPDSEAPELPVVALVGNKLVNRAIDAGHWDTALAVGPRSGVLAVAKHLAASLGCGVLVDVDERGVPLVWAEQIPGTARGPGVVSVLCERRRLEAVTT